MWILHCRDGSAVSADRHASVLPKFTSMFHGAKQSHQQPPTRRFSLGFLRCWLALRDCIKTIKAHAGLPQFEYHAKRSLQVLWSMRTPLGLFGTALDMQRAVWLDPNGGIGASADSFYEYLLKAYILFGEASHRLLFLEHAFQCRIFPDRLSTCAALVKAARCQCKSCNLPVREEMMHALLTMSACLQIILRHVQKDIF